MSINSVLLVDDEEDVLRATTQVLKGHYKVFQALDGQTALKLFAENKIDLVILDINMPGLSGIEVLFKLKEADPFTEIIMLTADSSPETIIQAMRGGAYDYLIKPYEPDELLLKIDRAMEKIDLVKENNSLKDQVRSGMFENIIGESPSMQNVFNLIRKVSSTDVTVLITGETGTGKELAARAIHNQSSRCNKPLITVNAGSIPKDLLESELFGYKKGAFTGAVENKIGKFELADGGTIFLDEIGNMPIEMQAKLLRVIQEKEIEKIGDTKAIPLDIRIIAATNTDLKKAIADGKFRDDLYHRLNVIQIELPPLRERDKDIKLLAAYFLEKHNKKLNKDFQGINSEAMDQMRKYTWPGNIRELEHLIERIITIEDEAFITCKYLPREIVTAGDTAPESLTGQNLNLKDAVQKYEKELISSTLKKNDFNQSSTARILGISRTTLISKMQALNITH
ncbi:MAG: sigma-54 dependent transcriptional regulator [Candidatus Margulisiibacteriota bacterium]